MRSVWPESFTLSAFLHALVVGSLVVYALFLAPRPEAAPRIFEMVAPPPLGDGRTPAPADAASDDGDEASEDPLRFNRPRVPLYDYGRLPQPAPEPVVEAPPPEAIVRPAERTRTQTQQTRAQQPPTMSYEEFQRQNQRNRSTTRAPVNAPRLTTPGPVGTGGSPTGVAGGVNPNELQDYFARLQGALKAAWQRPEGLSLQLEAVVAFDISETGVISGARIVSSSGNAQFDQSVLRVFDRVRTFSPPPGRQALRDNRQPFRMVED